MRRPPIALELQRRVLYVCAQTCCVCRRHRPVQIHHIDEDSSNNSYANLVALCAICHGDAHTKRKLAQNLTPALIKSHKAKWEGDVRTRSTTAMVPRVHLGQALWTYFNHQRFSAMMERAGYTLASKEYRDLLSIGLIDKHGFPLPQSTPSPTMDAFVTVYDYLEYYQRHRVHRFLSREIDHFIQRVTPLELDALWTRRDIKALVHPGAIAFTHRAFYFRRISRNRAEHCEVREVYYQARGIRLTFQVNTRDMFGTSSISDSFAGHRSAAVLLCIKSLSSDDGKLVIHATPIAMGSGFLDNSESSPRKHRGKHR